MRTRSIVVVVAAIAVGTLACGPKIFPLTPTGITVSSSEELVARGEYLFHGPTHCSACHTTAEAGAAIKGGDRPAPTGGHVWVFGPLGTLRSPNITQDAKTGVGTWSDEDIARLLKHGLRPDGTVSPFMRFALGTLADDDVAAIVAYMRTIPPATNVVPRHELSWIGGMVMGGLEPRVNTLKAAPPIGATVERGRYLAYGPANCVGCHSEADGFEPKKGREFVGASEPMPSEFEDDPNMFRAPNLTPSKTGITGKWSEEQFVARFKEGRAHKGSPMPWGNLQNLQEDDIKALYMFLKTLPPDENKYDAIETVTTKKK